MNKKLAVAAIAATLTASLTACGSDDGGSGGDTINFGYIGDYNGTSLLAIADDQDMWEDAGLDVETQVFNDGPTQIQALGSGDLDYGYIGPGAVWLPAQGKATMIAMNTIGAADRVIAQPGIESIEDLKGKKVAVPEGTSGEMILGLALEKAGMTMDDITTVPMDPPTVVNAFGSGKVDAAGIFYPLVETMKQQVPDLVELAENSDFEDEVSFPNMFVGSSDAGDDEQTTDVVKVLRQAMDYRAENPDEAVEVTAEMLEQPVETVEKDASHNNMVSAEEMDALTEDGSINDWLTSLQEFFVESGQLDKAVDPSTFYLGDEFVAAGK